MERIQVILKWVKNTNIDEFIIFKKCERFKNSKGWFNYKRNFMPNVIFFNK